MDALPKLTVEQKQKLKQVVREKAEEFLDKLLTSVDEAEMGRLIADSEEPVRQAIHELGQAAFEAAIQAKVDAAEAAFPPSTQQHDEEAVAE